MFSLEQRDQRAVQTQLLTATEAADSEEVLAAITFSVENLSAAIAEHGHEGRWETLQVNIDRAKQPAVHRGPGNFYLRVSVAVQ